MFNLLSAINLLLKSSMVSRYITAGALINALLYLLYIIVTYLGMMPQIALTLTFVIGFISSYYSHMIVVFKNKSNGLHMYIIVYIVAYFLNLALFQFLYVYVGIPHQITVLISGGIASLFTFWGLRLWVFPAKYVEESS